MAVENWRVGKDTLAFTIHHPRINKGRPVCLVGSTVGIEFYLLGTYAGARTEVEPGPKFTETEINFERFESKEQANEVLEQIKKILSEQQTIYKKLEKIRGLSQLFPRVPAATKEKPEERYSGKRSRLVNKMLELREEQMRFSSIKPSPISEKKLLELVLKATLWLHPEAAH